MPLEDLAWEMPRLLRHLVPSKIALTRPYLTCSDSLRILDLGCGNHSPTAFRTAFPKCEYVGVDRRLYNLSPVDLTNLDRLIQTDLDTTSLAEVSDDNFDLVVVSHVLEHLHRGCGLLDVAIPKLRKNGILFVAFPNPDSVNFPSLPGTLNFYDDTEHVTLLSISEVERAVSRNGLQVVRSGTTRRARNLVLMPLRSALSILNGGLRGPPLWDLFGFEQFVVAKRVDLFPV
jgi:2-polyprenyl-3-methyl-5-hydroxy-6-metoxy-1,4-benzoquinol methylase